MYFLTVLGLFKKMKPLHLHMNPFTYLPIYIFTPLHIYILLKILDDNSFYLT